MPNKVNFAGAALAAIVLLGGVAAGAGQAQAHGFRYGLHRGSFGGGFGGGASYFPGCRWVPKHNIFGDYVGLVRVCRY
jgi:hypothetical protein